MTNCTGKTTKFILLAFLSLTLAVPFSGCNGDAGAAPTLDVERIADTPAPGGESTKEADAVARVDQGSVTTGVEHLSGVKPAPLSSGEQSIQERGSADGRNLAKEYIRKNFEAAGLQVEEQPFTSSDGKKGTNVIGTLRGSDPKSHLHVTAHYDSAGNPGAEDNASGVVGMMTAAKAIQGMQPKANIHFIALDLEETGLVGAYYYVQEKVKPLQAAGDHIIGNMNLDMIGHSNGENLAILADCNEAPELVRAFEDAIRDYSLPLKPDTGDCSPRSDNKRFSDEGIPALYVMDDSFVGEYPWYHEQTDTADRLDMGFLTNMTRAVTVAVARLAG